MKFSADEIENYYDATRSHYSYFWRLNEHHSLHYGYWDESTKNFTEALIRINEVMAEHAGVGNGMRILDSGCGEGGSVAWLATHFDVDAVGITLSKKQMLEGNDFLKRKSLNGKIEVQNFIRTNFPDNHFDIVWAIESVCHAESKREYLTEMFRILKPGGKIILADFFVVNQLSLSDQKCMDNWAHAWAVPAFESVERFSAYAFDVGFSGVKAQNITSHIEKSVTRLYRLFYLGLPGSLLYNSLFPKTNAAGKRNVYSAYWQYKTFRKRLWTYQLVCMQKGDSLDS